MKFHLTLNSKQIDQVYLKLYRRFIVSAICHLFVTVKSLRTVYPGQIHGLLLWGVATTLKDSAIGSLRKQCRERKAAGSTFKKKGS